MKRKILTVVILVTLLLTSCMANEEDVEKETLEYAKSDDDNEIKARPYEDIISNVDFTEPHIQVELKDKLTIDADVSTNVPENLGVYVFEDVNNVDDNTRVELEIVREAEVVKLVDEYFGEDVIVTVEEVWADEEAGKNTTISSSLGHISFSCNEDDKYKVGVVINEYFPNIDSEYDAALIEEKIDGFINHFSSILPEGVTGEYRCLHFDDVFWKTSGQQATEHFAGNGIYDRDYYWIRLYNEVEQNVYYNVGYNNIRINQIGESSWPKAFMETSDGKLVNYYLDSYVDIYLDENGELFAFDIVDYVEVGECAEVVDIISAKDALGTVYDLYKDNTVYQQITINEVMLTYSALPGDEVNEDGYRAAYVKPVWMVYFTKDNGEEYCRCIIIDAKTGEVISRIV